MEIIIGYYIYKVNNREMKWKNIMKLKKINKNRDLNGLWCRAYILIKIAFFSWFSDCPTFFLTNIKKKKRSMMYSLSRTSVIMKIYWYWRWNSVQLDKSFKKYNCSIIMDNETQSLDVQQESLGRSSSYLHNTTYG